ncbi:MAG TPA: deoxyribonuclease IV [Longimicrobiales bacterium]|nr:deoxyribonuclease IV [Longimicrobiales bacterium]
MNSKTRDELGAHVSAAGGVHRAPSRAAEIGAGAMQLFTKQPSRWAEPDLSGDEVRAFRAERLAHGLETAGAHDSYLINLSSPDPRLWRRSRRSFESELRRCVSLGLDFLVTHPGNATDGDLRAGIIRNAEAIAQSLDSVDGETRVLLELTAGSGTSVGGSFEGLSAILERIPAPWSSRVGVCLDTCHAYSAGYDLVEEYDRVWDSFDDLIGLDRLGLIHLNDSKHPLGSRKDRHEVIGAGTLGTEPFRRIVLDERFRTVPKVLETPKGEDGASADRKNLALLRRLRRSG